MGLKWLLTVIMSIFKDKTLLITGGTGSFGNMVLKRFLESEIKEIRIFSRDEKKQDDMRHHLHHVSGAETAPQNKEQNLSARRVERN